MTEDQKYRVRFPTAADVFEAQPQIAEDIVARPNGEAPVSFVRSLLKSKTPEEAVTFTAYLLAVREAVWMGHECLIHVKPNLGDSDMEMLNFAEAWVRSPCEETRNAALEAGMEQNPKSPGAWIALAAGWSSGSMLPPDQHPVTPPDGLVPRAVNAGILSALARLDASVREKTLIDFVEIGLTIIESD
ncbi:MAG: DUF6931 family protein [Rhizobiaceae bacterium]